MSLDTATTDFLANAARRPARLPPAITLEEFRQAVEAFRPLGFEPAEVERVEHLSVSRNGLSDVRLRLYVPRSTRNPPVMVWAHGGSWVRVTVDLLDGHFRAMANSSECAIAAVDYTLSPEARFPAAIEEIYAAAKWLRSSSARLALDGDRVGIGGESSGGNLAAATAIVDRERREVGFTCQVLIVPVLDLNFESASWSELGKDYLLTSEQLEWATEQYAPGMDRANPLLSPLRLAQFADLPMTIIKTGEYDPLKDDGAKYAGALEEAGVHVAYTEVPGLIHHAIMAPTLMRAGHDLVLRTATEFGHVLHDDARSKSSQ